MSGMLIPPASSLQGLQLQTLAASTEAEFKPDRPSVVFEVRFWSASSLSNALVKIRAQGINIASGQQVPLPLLVTRAAVDVQSGVLGYLYIWRPSNPLLWSQEMPLGITSSVACTVYVDGAPMPSAAAGGRS